MIRMKEEYKRKYKPNTKYNTKATNASATPIDQIKQIKWEPLWIELNAIFDDSASSV